MNMDELNKSQEKAATFEGKHLLVLAGAGTGKTKTIIARASYLISTGVDPSKIQILTFTKRAANEIVSRVKAEFDKNQAMDLRGSTFHSWCNQLLTQFPNLFGTNTFTIIDEDDQVNLMKSICGKKPIQLENIKLDSQRLVDIYSFMRNTKLSLADSLKIKIGIGDNNYDLEDQTMLKDHNLRLLYIENFFHDYHNKKLEKKYLDYDDMLLVVATRLTKDENAREIIGNLYKHFLVDEMQDTNPLQWDLLNPLQEKSHLFCVGDDAQSIYSFRGADFKNVHLFKERVKDSEVYKLEENYRSTQEILDISNWLLEQSNIKYDKKLKAVRGNGNKPEIINVENNWKEADFIADKIIENYTNNNKKYGDHLVLARSSFYTRELQAEFIKRKIPFKVYGGRKFMESAHIKDLISAMRIVNNKDDELAWMRYLTLWEGIGEVKATQLSAPLSLTSNIVSCIHILKESRHVTNNNIFLILEAIYENQNNVQRAVHKSYELIQKRMSEKYKEDWEKKRKLDFPILEELAKNYSTLGEFISGILLDDAVSKSPSILSDAIIPEKGEEDAVIISTVHSAKGLEADTCFVINVSPGSYPSNRAKNDDEIEEERRVLYVALTRAKNNLYITRNIYAIHGQNLIAKNVSEIQYFLNSLPENLCIQHVKVTKEIWEKTKDIDTPNELDLPYHHTHH